LLTTKYVIAGIDPGLTGGIAIYNQADGEWLYIGELPVVIEKDPKGKKKDVKSIDVVALAKLLKEYNVDYVFIEKVHAMPGQGVTSMFTFGEGYGRVNAVAELCTKEVRRMTPQVWQKIVFGSTDKTTPPKERAVALAIRLIGKPPMKHRGRVPHLGMCDAVCIARAGSVSLNMLR
jgi:Holliday junction resolvasome RuvABC endonuclease subunit